MPLYSFHCSECDSDFELFLRPSEVIRGVPCLVCGERIRQEGREPAADVPAPEPAPVCGLPRGT